MYLIDSTGIVHTDEYPVDERVVESLRKSNPQPTLVCLPEYEILYRFDVDGDLTVYYIGGRPFVKVNIDLYGLHTYQDKRSYISEEFRIVPFADKEARVYVGDVSFSMPEELLMRW